jgi:broad specificity phosphatase PhoE
LSDEGRKVAREMGGAMKALGIRLGEVYTSQLNRAIETGSLLLEADGNPVGETAVQAVRRRWLIRAVPIRR